jgi:hypothetical protein
MTHTRLPLAALCAAVVLAACQEAVPVGAPTVPQPGVALQPPSFYTTSPGPNGTRVPDVSVNAR